MGLFSKEDDFLARRVLCRRRPGALASPCEIPYEICIKCYSKAQKIKIGDEEEYLFACKDCNLGKKLYNDWVKMQRRKSVSQNRTNKARN